MTIEHGTMTLVNRIWDEATDKFCHRHIVARRLNEICSNVGEIETVDTKGTLFESI